MSTDSLEPRDSEDVRKADYLIETLSADRPLDGQVREFCILQRATQREYKRKWMELWSQLVTENQQRFSRDGIPATFEEFMQGSRKEETLLSMVTLWTPKALRNVLPLRDLARRVDETVSFRGMLYYITSVFFWKVLKNDYLHPGDAFDAHHGVAAANFDVFVCKDRNARKYAGAWCRGGQRVVTLDDFMMELS